MNSDGIYDAVAPTGAIPVIPEPAPLTGAIPVAVDAAAPTGAIPLVPDSMPFTGAIPVVPEYAAQPATGAIPVLSAPEIEFVPEVQYAPEAEFVPEAEYLPVQYVSEGEYSPEAEFAAVPGVELAPPAGPLHFGPPPLDQWQFAPYLQWSMQHIEDFLPVHRIARGRRSTEFKRRDSAVEAFVVPHPWEDRSASFAEVMGLTHTDGWMLLHGDTIVAERYFGEFAESGRHLLMSVSKSLTATTAGLLAAKGKLDLDRLVTEYVPELRGSGYDGALVRHLVDMRTAVLFSEEYLDENAEVRLLEEAIGWAPKRHPEVPDTLLGFLATLGSSGEHGGAFDYKSCETDALGFVIGGAAKKHAADVMSRLLWAPMGAEFDAHVGVDSVGAGMFDGGVSAAVRDLARYGHLFANKGRALNGKRVLPEALVEDTFNGGPDSREAFANSPEPTLMPGGMYRNGFWFPGESDDVMLALGIHGQMIYINRATGVVGVKVSSWPTPQDAEKLFWTVRAFETASWALNAGEL